METPVSPERNTSSLAASPAFSHLIEKAGDGFARSPASCIVGASVDVTADLPQAMRTALRGWTLRRVYLYAGAVRFIWRCPLGSEYGMSGNHDEREALLTALRWWKLRAAQIERNRGSLLHAVPPVHLLPAGAVAALAR